MVKILNYERANKGKVVAFVDVIVPIAKPVNIIIRRIARVEGSEKDWYNLPSFSKERLDGKKDFIKYFQFETDSFTNQLSGAIAVAADEYCRLNNISKPDPLQFNDYGSYAQSANMDDMPF